MEDYKKLMSKKTLDELKENLDDLQLNIAVLEKKKERISMGGAEKVDEKIVAKIEEEEKMLRK
jgi:chaperonin cofactor prefoldin